MARNGSGTYSLPSGNPVVTGTTISSTTQNNTLSDIATALTQSLAKDGQTTPTANLPMGGFKLTGLASGSARTDSASIANIQDGTGFYAATVGGTSDVITLTPSPAFVAYTAGQLISFISSGANTTNVTVNISGLGAKAVTKNGATALVAGDIPASALIHIQYDGTQFQLVNVNVNPLSSITGLGTGVATALAVNLGSAGAVAGLNTAQTFTKEQAITDNVNNVTLLNVTKSNSTAMTSADTPLVQITSSAATNDSVFQKFLASGSGCNVGIKKGTSNFVIRQNTEVTPVDAITVTQAGDVTIPDLQNSVQWAQSYTTAAGTSGLFGFNTTGLTDNGVGDTTINLSITMSNASQVVTASANTQGRTANVITTTTTTVRIITANTAAVAEDLAYVAAIGAGSLA